MNGLKPLDYALLALLGVWFLWAVRHIIRQRKRGGCCGCSGCSHAEEKSRCTHCAGDCAHCRKGK